jgi:hypothetical protein
MPSGGARDAYVARRPRATDSGRYPRAAGGGRPRPHVARYAVGRVDPDRWEGLRESLPFLFFGGVCVLLAIWLEVANPVPGNPLPLWTLLLGIGIASLGGGLIAPLFPSETASRPARRPMREAYPTLGSEEEGELEVPSRGGETAGLLEVDPLTTAPPVREVALPRRAALAATAEDPLEPPPSVGPEGPTRRGGSLREAPSDARAAADEVLRNIEELTRIVHRSPRSDRTTDSPDHPLLLQCGDCDGPIGPGESATSCRECGRALCASCAEQSLRGDPAGLCTTCSLLVPAPPPLRAKGERPKEARSRLWTPPRPANA